MSRSQIIRIASLTAVLAVLTSLAWAWAVAIVYPPFDGSSQYFYPGGTRRVSDRADQNFVYWFTQSHAVGLHQGFLGVGSGLDARPELRTWPRWLYEKVGFAGISTIAYGWPWPMLRVVVVNGSGLFVIGEIEQPWRFSFVGHQFRLPVRVVWWGAVGNWMVHWLLLCVPIGSVVWVRKRRRRARGLCPGCAYPVGVSPRCTECGRVVTPRRAAHGQSHDCRSTRR